MRSCNSINRLDMFNQYLKTMFRNLWKNRSHSFLNMIGLAIGITCAGLIFLWVEDEMHYDRFHGKKDRLYLILTNSKLDGRIFTHSSTPCLLGPALQAEVPGIGQSCRATEGTTSILFNSGDKPVYASGRYVDPSFFTMFTLLFVQGNARDAFKDLYSLVITEQAARKFFGNERQVLGKTILVDNKQEYVITGVLKDLPENSSLRFEWLSPFKIFYDQNPGARKWGNSCINTYVELTSPAKEVTVDKQLSAFMKTKQTDNDNGLFLFGMSNWRLYDQFENGKSTGGGRIEYVRLFSVIAWVILTIACINFMNLATARSEKRAREVGVRKVLGAGKKRLIGQFIGEAIFMSTLAALFAVVLITLVLPAFNFLVQKNLSAGFGQPVHLLVLAGIALISGLVAGSYPALYLSSFNPVFVLKGVKLKTGSAAFIRKGLVVLQFTVSIILIIGTIIIYQQLQHVKDRNLGFRKENLVQIEMRNALIGHYASLKQDLLNTGYVENTALADHGTIYAGNNTTGLSWAGKDPGSQILVSQRLVSYEFIATSAMQLISGRDFRSTDAIEMGPDFRPKDPNGIFNVVVTESMGKLLGKDDPVGKALLLPGDTNGTPYHLNIVGVVKDYMYGNMYGKPDPVVFYPIPQATDRMYVRIKPTDGLEKALAAIGGVMHKYNPAYPFEYVFVDDQFNALFTSEMLMSRLSRVFAMLTIIISCLGLFGLAAYTAERRTKEIGIRKVLGASVPGITGLLTKDFLKLVSISAIIAFPIAWWTMHSWLRGFEYRVGISWWVFAAAGVLALLIALITISTQAIRAAVANPVKSLRTE